MERGHDGESMPRGRAWDGNRSMSVAPPSIRLADAGLVILVVSGSESVSPESGDSKAESSTLTHPEQTTPGRPFEVLLIDVQH